jgi:hypothetical protein
MDEQKQWGGSHLSARRFAEGQIVEIHAASNFAPSKAETSYFAISNTRADRPFGNFEWHTLSTKCVCRLGSLVFLVPLEILQIVMI